MTPSDVRLIDPTFGALATAVLKATRVANGRVRRDRIDKDVPGWHRSLRRVFRKPSGRQEWPSKRSLYGAPLVKLAWWTDRLGRKHWRVVGGRRSWPEMHVEEGWPLAKHHLWHVYPDRLLWRKAGGREEVLAACGCGVVGTPEAISWTGERCGPCHDRLEEGVPVPAERPARVEMRRHSAMVGHVVFLPDGRMVTGGGDGRVVLWGEDGSSRVLLHRRGGCVYELAASASGLVAARTGYNRLLLLDLNREQEWRTVPVAGGYTGLGPAFSPDGERLLVGVATGTVVMTDLAAPEPAQRPLAEGRVVQGAVFGPSGEEVYGFEPGGAVVRVSLSSGLVTTLRPGPVAADLSEGLSEELEMYLDDEPGLMPLLAPSPDGRWLVAAGMWQNHMGMHRCHLPTGAWAPLEGSPSYFPRSVVFTGPDELMATNGDATVSVWSLSEAAVKATWCPSARPWYGATFLSPGGEWLVQAHNQGEVVMRPWKEALAAAR